MERKLIDLLNSQIIKLHDGPTKFSEKIGISEKNLTHKKKAFINKINWCNDFLKELGMRVEIVENKNDFLADLNVKIEIVEEKND